MGQHVPPVPDLQQLQMAEQHKQIYQRQMQFLLEGNSANLAAFHQNAAAQMAQVSKMSRKNAQDLWDRTLTLFPNVRLFHLELIDTSVLTCY